MVDKRGRVRRAFRGLQQDGEATGKSVRQVVPAKAVAALLGCAAGSADEAAQMAVSASVRGKQDDARAVVELDLRSDDELQRERLRPDVLVGPHDSGEGAFVGDGQCVITQFGGPAREFLGLRGPALEAEAAQTMEFGVSGEVGFKAVHRYSIKPGGRTCASALGVSR